jgi:hypothetical protein
METTSHTVNLRYERRELHALFEVANAKDVKKGGRYDARGGAIHILHELAMLERKALGYVKHGIELGH